MGAARFRPTWRQALGRGLCLGVLLCAGGLSVLAGLALAGGVTAPPWLWLLVVAGPPVAGVLAGVLLRRRLRIEAGSDGIRTVTPFGAGVQPWSRVVDLRAERRGARTVVSVYLDSGASMQLLAPYDGGMFAADPRFEMKVSALAHLWRSHRIGGLPS
ncbi:PH domain-containing protein [Actinoplanes sp. NPDC049316]|uniref:PH domain-containing protein n=1 Tax=Actinoplanes sp. NPDC049316 TaxID=3154727 RepID=UPI0034487056